MMSTETRQMARDDLHRSMPFTVTRAGSGDATDGLTLEGDAAVFNSATVIDSWEGRFKEVLVPGSFKKTLRERTPRLQFDHGAHPLIGSLPIGRLTEAYEDGERAVHVVARLSDNWLVQPVRDAIAEGSVDGMSFRFSVVRDEWREPDGKVLKSDEEIISRLWSSQGLPEAELLERNVKELKCFELGPVVWPAYEATSVGVRSQKITIDLGRLNRPEERSALARAVLAADLAERSIESPGSDATPDAPPLERHPSVESADPNDAPPPGGHPSESTTSSTPSDEGAGRSDPAANMLRDMQATLARIHERNTDD